VKAYGAGHFIEGLLQGACFSIHEGRSESMQRQEALRL